MIKVVCIGGGTGTTAVLKGLKQYQDLDLSVIVTMMDDGGSNAVVRDEFGVLPLSDLRKSILSLSSQNEEVALRSLFTYRFSKGNGLSGHTLGNLIMLALTDVAGSELGAIEALSELFNVQGKIIPVTTDHVRLVAEYDDGTKEIGEHNIDEPKGDRKIVKLSLNKRAKAYKEATKSIIEADYVVIGPGDLYTSILPNIIVSGISETLQNTKAKIIYISNLMSKKGETRGMKLSELITEIEKYSGREIDYVLHNTESMHKQISKKYRDDGEHLFENDIESDLRLIGAKLLAQDEVKKTKGDIIKRSYIRHDPVKLGKELYSIMRPSLFSLLPFLKGGNR